MVETREPHAHTAHRWGEFKLAQRFADAVTLALANAKARSQLEELARTDELTGCLNRRGFGRGRRAAANRLPPPSAF